MSDLLKQLDGDDAVLLMYLADELGSPERAIVERRLASDAAFAAALDGLRGADDAFRAGMASLDTATPLPVDPALVVRNVSRLLRDRPMRITPAQQPATPMRLMPRWAVPAAAAAAVLVVASIVWRTLDQGAPAGGQSTKIASVTTEPETFEVAAANTLMRDTEDWAIQGIARADEGDGSGILFGLSSEVDASQP